MIRLRCIAIDDEPPALEVLRAYVSQTPGIEMVQAFDDALSAGEFLRHNKVDLIFLDINMPDINGIDLARSLDQPPMIIFTTAYRKFAVEGFELKAIDYLLKPISPDRFKTAIQKAVEYYQYRRSQQPSESDYLFVHSEYRMLKLPLAQIAYIESLEDYVRIHLTEGKPVMSLIPLKKVMERLPPDRFCRIHRSYIVAIDKVIAIQNRRAEILNTALPISDSYISFIDQWKSR